MIDGLKVAVVLPAYNAAKTLRQTYEELPHEIVDDVVGGVPVAVTWYPSATRASCTPVR